MYTRQQLPAVQRTLVTVVTNAEPLPLEQKIRQNDSSRFELMEMKMFISELFFLGGFISRTKRHVTTAPYPTDKRMQQRDHQANDNHQNRGRKRPCMFKFIFKYFYFDNLGQKPDGFPSGSTTLEIRKIPVESNTILKLNEHFSRFGTVTNVQVSIKYCSNALYERKI